VKLATFTTGTNDRVGADDRVGVLIGDELADLSAADAGPATLVDLVRGPGWPARVAALLPSAPRHPVESVTFRAPVPRPPKYLAIGLNSPDHRREINLRWLMREPRLIRIAAGYLQAHPRPKYPFFFAKATSSVTGPYDPIWLPGKTRRVDWEGELAFIVGTRAREVPAERAKDYIAGYLIANDISVRDWQTDNPTAPALAKGFETHGPLGPCLVSADGVDPAELSLRTYLNGELRQSAQIADLILGPAEILSTLSMFCTLEPGDVVACGTFAGTGWPTGRFLRPGDSVRVEIDRLGHIENTVEPAPAAFDESSPASASVIER
jgi:2-keto-4-pentenoate hydratase/2-oxohepta-3-ene-1,7-dioic acid hydratase in catechol pathway